LAAIIDIRQAYFTRLKTLAGQGPLIKDSERE
jgi:hypothetical protein